jgi:hypothetical protein
MPALTFTRTVPGTYAPGSGTMSGSTTTDYVGAGIRVRGDPQRYKALGLVESEAPTILWTAETYGDPTPPIGAKCSLNGIAYRVRDVSPVDPDFQGHIVARLIVERP